MQTYGTTIDEIIQASELNPLGPGRENHSIREQLNALSIERVFDSIDDRQMASCVLSGLWLLHNFLDESHTISQGIHSPEGSFWHGIMHRREPDYSNAKYWFRRVGEHPVFEQIAKQYGDYDPFDFVDRCQSAVGNAEAEQACREIQAAEWRLLFDHCFRHATGS